VGWRVETASWGTLLHALIAHHWPIDYTYRLVKCQTINVLFLCVAPWSLESTCVGHVLLKTRLHLSTHLGMPMTSGALILLLLIRVWKQAKLLRSRWTVAIWCICSVLIILSSISVTFEVRCLSCSLNVSSILLVSLGEHEVVEEWILQWIFPWCYILLGNRPILLWNPREYLNVTLLRSSALEFSINGTRVMLVLLVKM